MIRIDKNTGNLIVEIKVERGGSAAEALEIRRDALYNMIIEHDSENYICNEKFYGIVLLLRDLDLTFEQYKKALN